MAQRQLMILSCIHSWNIVTKCLTSNGPWYSNFIATDSIRHLLCCLEQFSERGLCICSHVCKNLDDIVNIVAALG